MKRKMVALGAGLLVIFMLCQGAALAKARFSGIYDVGTLKPIDSVLRVKVGQEAPDFTLPSITGEKVSLSKDYRGKKNVVISFVPAAWTPVCSDQWPGYNIAKDKFKKYDAVLLGISVDNIPSLHAWTQKMGKLWFPVLSDFWPHGKVCRKYGVLRSDGMADRVVIVINKKGRITFVDVHNINMRPPLEDIINELKRIQS